MEKYTKESQEDKYLLKPKAFRVLLIDLSHCKKEVRKEIKSICYCTAGKI